MRDRTREKVAILGFTQHNMRAPWHEADWDLWGLNDLHNVFEAHVPGIFQTDRAQWFQLHREEWNSFPGARDPNHTGWMKQQTCPIWMWHPHADVPTSRAYPLQEVLAAFPRAYFNNSISWMIALAILRGYRTIGLWGVDMALDGVHGQSEYSWQRPSVEYLVGLAEGRGLEVVIPDESEILKCGYLYGFDNIMPTRRKFLDRLDQLEAQQHDASNDYEAIKRGLHETRGAIWAVKQLKADHPKLVELEQRELGLVNEYEAAKRAIHEIVGAKNDLTWVIRNYFPGEGAYQDVARTPRSLIRTDRIVDLTAYAALPDKSDGKTPVNRIQEALSASREPIALEPLSDTHA